MTCECICGSAPPYNSDNDSTNYMRSDVLQQEAVIDGCGRSHREPIPAQRMPQHAMTTEGYNILSRISNGYHMPGSYLPDL